MDKNLIEQGFKFISDQEIIGLFLYDLKNNINNSTQKNYNFLYEIFYLIENNIDKDNYILKYYFKNWFNKYYYNNEFEKILGIEILLNQEDLNKIKNIINNYYNYSNILIWEFIEMDLEKALRNLEDLN